MRRAFTLIEMLVVIGILAILVAILVPALGRAREKAKRAKCATNLYATGRAYNVYASQWNDSLPIQKANPEVLFSTMTLFAVHQLMDSHLADKQLERSSAHKILFCPSNPALGDSRIWRDGVQDHSQSATPIGYVNMARRAVADSVPYSNPPYFPYGIEYASDVAGSARRMPPLQFHLRMHNQTQPGRCDLALDAIISYARTSATNVKYSNIPSELGEPPRHGNFSWVPGHFAIPDFVGDRSKARGSTSHLNGTIPAGANVLSLDGHVEWRDWNPNTSYVAGIGPALSTLTAGKYYGGGTPYYWFPEP